MIRTRVPHVAAHLALAALAALAVLAALATTAALLAGCAREESSTTASRTAATQAAGPAGRTIVLTCGDILARVEFADSLATLRVAGETYALARVPSASGARYESASDPTTWLWNQGDSTTVTVKGLVLAPCAGAPEGNAPYRAHGNEPFWSLEIEGAAMTWRTPEETLTGTVSGSETIAGGRRTTGKVGDRTLVVTATTRVCHDGMSGMPYPEAVTVKLGDSELRGCGGNPVALLQGPEWRVVEVAGAPVPEGSRVTLTFGIDGRASGNASCNSFSAPYELTGEGIAFGIPVSTEKACDEPLMKQEAAFLGALHAVKRFDVDAEGALVLSSDDGRGIRATSTRGAKP